MTHLNPLIAMVSLALASQAGAANWLDDGDQRALEGAAQHSLEFAKTDEPTDWINPDTDSAGTFTPVATHQDANGQVCREYTITGTIGGEQQQIYGVACRQPDGSWREANTAAEAPPPVVRRYSNPYRYPYRYRYGTPYGWLGTVPYLSFSGAYCDGGFCVGGRYGYPIWFSSGFGLSFGHRGYSGGYYGYGHARSHYRGNYRGHDRGHYRGGHSRRYRGGRHSRGH